MNYFFLFPTICRGKKKFSGPILNAKNSEKKERNANHAGKHKLNKISKKMGLLTCVLLGDQSDHKDTKALASFNRIVEKCNTKANIEITKVCYTLVQTK